MLTSPKRSHEPVVIVEVLGRPATFATRGEQPWKEAVRAAVSDASLSVIRGRLSVRVELRLPAPTYQHQGWDIDNLLKPTIDALEGVLGIRQQRGRPQANDERIDHVEAWKRPAADGPTGATMEIAVLAPPWGN